MEIVEIDAKEAQKFFGKLGVKFAFNTAYKSEANGKNERRHSPIVKTLVKVCNDNVFD